MARAWMSTYSSSSGLTPGSSTSAPGSTGPPRRSTTTTSARGNSPRPRAIRSGGPKPERFYLGSGNSLARAHPPRAAASDSVTWSSSGSPLWTAHRPVVDGGLSIPAHTAGLLAPCADNDQASQAGPWTVSYTSSPFTRPQAIAGPVTATIYASSSTSETELVASLEDVTPDGSSYPLTQGALLGSLRSVDAKRSWTVRGVTLLPYHPYTQASARPVTPGAVTEYQIEIFPRWPRSGAVTGSASLCRPRTPRT